MCYNDFDEDFNEFDNEDFDNAWFAKEEARKWESGEYVNHCEDCEGEDCPCCQYNPNNE